MRQLSLAKRQALAAIRDAYLCRQLTVRVTLGSPATTGWFLTLLRELGIVTHFEPCATRVRPSVVTPIRQGYRLYLSYHSGAPAVKFGWKSWNQRGAVDVSINALRRATTFGPGVTLVLATSRGWYTHLDCLRAGLGGRVVLSVSGG